MSRQYFCRDFHQLKKFEAYLQLGPYGLDVELF